MRESLTLAVSDIRAAYLIRLELQSSICPVLHDLTSFDLSFPRFLNHLEISSEFHMPLTSCLSLLPNLSPFNMSYTSSAIPFHVS